ncbi:MAG TPA: PD-(D/E)XK nuclease family protein, partial [Ideonella sp.]|nr:PD-(D/E)XK nuclease family protein [Ideonella sp.]
ARLGAALGALEPAGGALRMSRWVALWVRAFDAAPWADRERWSSADYQSVERFRELLVQLASADALFGTLGAGAAAALLGAAAREVAFQPQTGIPPIWITSQVADPWLCYDALWIGGLSAEAWPPPIDPVLLLPVDLQRRYGVERASSAACLEAALDLGRRWARRAPVAVFGLSDRDESRSAAPSPLLGASLAQLDLDAAATVPRLWAELRARAPALDALVDEAAPPLAPGETTRGVATLRAQSLCAFRGFADSRLRCEPLRLPQPGFDPAERGILVHAALEHIWAALGDRAALAALDAPARAQLVSTATAAAVEAARARRDPGPRWRDRERGRLERLLARWLDLERERTDFAVERLEQGRQIARHAGLEFSCRIDRVDRLADGSRVLIDYKTGITSTDWRGERPANPQLPLYAGLAGDRLVAVAYAQVSAADCRFVAETERADALVPGGRRTSLEGARDLRELMERWRSRLDRLAAEFRDGRAAVDPMPRACETCRLQVLCRIGDGADVEQADE